MSADDLNLEMSAIDSLISKGDFHEALHRTNLLREIFPEDRIVMLNTTVFLSEIGAHTRNEGVLTSALAELVRFREEASYEPYRAQISFALGNGYSNLYTMKMEREKRVAQLFRDSYLQEAKKYQRETTKLVGKEDSELFARAHTNLGNTLDALGRAVEALLEYDDALRAKPTHAMAKCNKAMALRNLSSICGEGYTVPTLIEAYQILASVLQDGKGAGGLDSDAKSTFDAVARSIREEFDNPEILKVDLTHDKFDASGMTEFEKFYVRFCSDRRLFLNFHVIDHECEAAIVDPIFLSHIGGLEDEKKAYDLFKYFNQIKEDYMVARMMLVESQYRRPDLDSISKRTTLVNTLDYSVFNIYAGYLKSSFKQAYGILDKIAILINRFLDMGLQDKKIAFDEIKGKRSIWNDSNDEPRMKVVERENLALYALYDIARDLNSAKFRELRAIRHALVHRRLLVYEDWAAPTLKDAEDSTTYDRLLSDTISLMRLVKAAIVYLFAFVDSENRKKREGLEGPVMRLHLDDSQGI